MLLMSRLIAVAAIGMLAACASELVMQPAQFAPAAVGSPGAEIQIASNAVATSSAGRHRDLEAGSRWQAVGHIAQGNVYKRVDGIFVVQARNVHEAYLVVSGGRLQGFYLPVENAFSPANPSVQLTLKENR